MNILRTAVASKLSVAQPDYVEKEGRFAFYNGLKGPVNWLSDQEFVSLIASAAGLGDDGWVQHLQVLHLYQGLLPQFSMMCIWYEMNETRAHCTLAEEIAVNVAQLYKQCDGVRGQTDPFAHPPEHSDGHINILDKCAHTNIHTLVKFGLDIANSISNDWMTDMADLAKVMDSWIPKEYIRVRDSLADLPEVHALHPLHTGGCDYNGMVLPCIRPACPITHRPTYPNGHEFGHVTSQRQSTVGSGMPSLSCCVSLP